MAINQKRRQKKLEKKRAKRKAERKELARCKNRGLTARLSSFTNAPVLHSLVTDVVWEQGIGSVLLSRQLNNGQVASANLLVDDYCLGVKNVHVMIHGSPAKGRKLPIGCRIRTIWLVSWKRTLNMMYIWNICGNWSSRQLNTPLASASRPIRTITRPNCCSAISIRPMNRSLCSAVKGSPFSCPVPTILQCVAARSLAR